MKKIKPFIGLAVLTAMLITPGCGTVPPSSQPTIDATAVILRGAARDGTLVATTPPSGNTNNVVYFKLASNALGTFITGKDYSPAALQTALMSLNVPQLQDPYVKIGIGTVIDLYQFYYGLYVAPNVASNAPVALEFITAVQDGINEALGQPATSRSAKAHFGSSIDYLPRPIVPIKR